MQDASLTTRLFSLFDRQLFEEDPSLAALIDETEARWRDNCLSDDMLSLVSAAGEACLPRRPHSKEDGETC